MNEIKEFFEKAALNWHNKDDISLIKRILKESGIKKGDKVLDVGCGKGIITPFIQEITNVSVKAIDISENMISGAKVNYPNSNSLIFECHDFYEYNDDIKYDYLIFYNAYPHFLDRFALSNKAKEILSENGKLVIAHGMSREALFKHHAGLNSEISRVIGTPIEESRAFFDHFDLEKWVDNETYYLMVLKKR